MFLHLSFATIFSTIPAFVFGQDYTVILLSLKKCPVKGNKELTYEMRLDKADDGSASFSFSGDLTLALDKSCTYIANVEMKNGGIYVPYMKTAGNICETLENGFKSSWDRFKQDVKPPIKAPCPINPGSYSINGYEIKKDEINVISMKGQFKVEDHFYCNNVEVACVLAEYLVEEHGDEDDEW